MSNYDELSKLQESLLDNLRFISEQLQAVDSLDQAKALEFATELDSANIDFQANDRGLKELLKLNEKLQSRSYFAARKRIEFNTLFEQIKQKINLLKAVKVKNDTPELAEGGNNGNQTGEIAEKSARDELIILRALLQEMKEGRNPLPFPSFPKKK
jgi:hypothetical protein